MIDGPQKTAKRPNPTDIYVGSRIRMRRKMLGLSQEKLGEKLGITFQQIQKYEKGTNRVGASRLQAMSDALEVPVAYFFPDSSSGGAGRHEGGGRHLHDGLHVHIRRARPQPRLHPHQEPEGAAQESWSSCARLARTGPA